MAIIRIQDIAPDEVLLACCRFTRSLLVLFVDPDGMKWTTP
jgi:hypothetical protein